jgi:hypothetical protein
VAAEDVSFRGCFAQRITAYHPVDLETYPRSGNTSWLTQFLFAE